MVAGNPGPADPASASALAIVRRVIGYARPYALTILAVAVCTFAFSAGRYGRAWLMKPLLDGVLIPVASAPVVTDEATESDWLSEAVARALPGGSSPGEDEATVARDWPSVRSAFREILLIALLIVIVTPLALFGRAYLSEYVLGRIDIDLKQRLAAKLLALPLSRHAEVRSGDLLTRAQSDTLAVREVARLVLQDFLVSATMIAIGIATLLHISVPLTLISLLAAPLIVGVLAGFGSRIRRSARARQGQLGEVTQRLVAILAGIKVIKAFGGERLESAAFARETRKLFRHDMRVVRGRVFSRAAVEALNSAAGVGMLAIGAVLVLQGRFGLTTGDVAAFATVLATTYKPVKDLSKGFGRLMECVASGERFFAVLDTQEEWPDEQTARALTGSRHHVRFEAVSVSHADGREGERIVLDRVSFDARPGEVVAIVGRTGAGKTTLIDLLLRFREASSGRVTIDGHDVRDLTRASLLRAIGVVTQEPFLFDTTIRENIRYARPSASDAEVDAAAKAAYVDEFVDELAAGYDTAVGEFGVRLSVGQRQRITIARALLEAPPILAFDEATSALDAKTERSVHDAIDALRGDRTILIVAHRLATVRRADRIVVIEDGRVRQQGTHAALMAEEGPYREGVFLQHGEPTGA